MFEKFFLFLFCMGISKSLSITPMSKTCYCSHQVLVVVVIRVLGNFKIGGHFSLMNRENESKFLLI